LELLALGAGIDRVRSYFGFDSIGLLQDLCGLMKSQVLGRPGG